MTEKREEQFYMTKTIFLKLRVLCAWYESGNGLPYTAGCVGLIFSTGAKFTGFSFPNTQGDNKSGYSTCSRLET